MSDSPSTLLSTSLLALGISLPEEVQARLLVYLDYVLKANEKLNLTSIEYPGAVTKHLVDSLSVMQKEGLASLEDPWLDLGSGAGFPGIPLAMAFPGKKIILVESIQKKAKFLEECVTALGLGNQVHVKSERAEALGKNELKAKCGLVVCRAVGKLSSLLAISMPLLLSGGRLIAYKGPKAEQEIMECSNVLKSLNCQIEKKLDFSLPFSGEARTLVVVRKLGIKS